MSNSRHHPEHRPVASLYSSARRRAHSLPGDQPSAANRRCFFLNQRAQTRGDQVDGTVAGVRSQRTRSEEHTSELQSRFELVCRLLLEKKQKPKQRPQTTST